MVVDLGPAFRWAEVFSLNNIDMADSQNGWLVGSGGVSFRTNDGGKTWS